MIKGFHAGALRAARGWPGLMLGAWLLTSAPAWALETDQQQPLYLEADNAEMDEDKRLSLYSGNVIVRQGSLEIRADQVTMPRTNARS